jgi:hypothetical protein
MTGAAHQRGQRREAKGRARVGRGHQWSAAALARTMGSTCRRTAGRRAAEGSRTLQRRGAIGNENQREQAPVIKRPTDSLRVNRSSPPWERFLRGHHVGVTESARPTKRALAPTRCDLPVAHTHAENGDLGVTAVVFRHRKQHTKHAVARRPQPSVKARFGLLSPPQKKASRICHGDMETRGSLQPDASG